MPHETPIYHITHIRNLSSIIANGAIVAQSLIQLNKVNYRNIAFSSIQDQRSTTVVPCGPQGNLHDYVPFYFAPRSPMLYTINRGNVEGYNEGQAPIIYLVSSIEQVNLLGLQFVFTDGHGIMFLTEFFDDLNCLNEVDWEVMKSRYWYDTNEDPDRKRRRQAEFLIYHRLPWDLVETIAVLNENVKTEVEKIISVANHQPNVICKLDWYY